MSSSVTRKDAENIVEDVGAHIISTQYANARDDFSNIQVAHLVSYM